MRRPVSARIFFSAVQTSRRRCDGRITDSLLTHQHSKDVGLIQKKFNTMLYVNIAINILYHIGIV